MGEKTVAIDAFEGNNLVLVDEGHRGTSGGENGAWLKACTALCERGFSFGYSATFQQAVSGERQFVEDLKTFHDHDGGFFKTRELYLLRNLSKGRGVGFFEAGNFHADFILWLLVGGQQHVVFVDPLGIRNIGQSDPKIQFYETIKEIEARLGDTNVKLDSFIVSNTPSHTIRLLWGVTKAKMASWHVLFQEEDRDTYVRSMLEAVLH